MSQEKQYTIGGMVLWKNQSLNPILRLNVKRKRGYFNHDDSRRKQRNSDQTTL